MSIEVASSTRASRAAFVVADLLPGARVERDPAAAIDVVWPVRGPRTLHLRVIGPTILEPRYPAAHAHVFWDVTRPLGARLMGDHPTSPSPDVLVLVRERAVDVPTDWTFRVLAASRLRCGRRSVAQLDALGAIELGAHHLPAAVQRYAGVDR